MPGGGSIQGMLNSLKANKSIRWKRKPFPKDHTHSSRKKSTKDEFDFPEATQKQLKEIGERMQKENRILFIKRSLLFIIILGALIYGIVLFLEFG